MNQSNNFIKAISSNGQITYEGKDRRNNSNGSYKLLFYLFSVAVGILVTAYFVWAANVNVKVNTFDDRFNARGERLAFLESIYHNACTRLEGIENKLDIVNNNVHELVKDVAVIAEKQKRNK